MIHQAELSEQLQIVWMVAWAMALGAVVGFERERRAKASGLRTHMLIAGSAAFIVAISVAVSAHQGAGDPSRGIHGVITGVGFLGAGAIFQSKQGMVYGLTTAASMFYTATLGCAVAAGYGITATIGTVLGLVVLSLIGRIRHVSNHPDQEQI